MLTSTQKTEQLASTLEEIAALNLKDDSHPDELCIQTKDSKILFDEFFHDSEYDLDLVELIKDSLISFRYIGNGKFEVERILRSEEYDDVEEAWTLSEDEFFYRARDLFERNPCLDVTTDLVY